MPDFCERTGSQSFQDIPKGEFFVRARHSGFRGGYKKLPLSSRFGIGCIPDDGNYDGSITLLLFAHATADEDKAI
jgi:hypothetical protein